MRKGRQTEGATSKQRKGTRRCLKELDRDLPHNGVKLH